MGRQLFQGTSYHDTPDNPLAELKYVDASPTKGAEYRVIVVNSVGLKSEPSKAIVAP
jgi:hypothetical protein